MQWIEWLGEHFIGLFDAGGKQFMDLFTGIVPTLVVLLTFTYAMIKFIGEERVTKAIQATSKFMIFRYTIMPILSILLLTNPMAYTFGRFVKEKQKPAFFDSLVSFLHPVTSLFPYANAGELFVYLGVANGLTQAGYATSELAIRFFLVGIVVMFLRGVITEQLTKILAKRM
ncbi:PTS system glucitol/sorbitol-specific EIIC component [Paraliobacillus ryukyuensis]|uniref:PTS system glucitol/sorbitol-specific IIC component n=1 Tax=Paraliobacillus ryukyuensis TaxID=200904 RepID=A0A366EE30_9BACI|nr:PTS glucitol/sorbitol transporter subunit IIC [Paraliobacillus ryukyuensis]RBP00647.1 PTS system glucitol/sorbitol-specific IIC component [Paraliobacillus ryukyuensis]